jgi:hypothetical protein
MKNTYDSDALNDNEQSFANSSAMLGLGLPSVNVPTVNTPSVTSAYNTDVFKNYATGISGPNYSARDMAADKEWSDWNKVADAEDLASFNALDKQYQEEGLSQNLARVGYNNLNPETNFRDDWEANNYFNSQTEGYTSGNDVKETPGFFGSLTAKDWGAGLLGAGQLGLGLASYLQQAELLKEQRASLAQNRTHLAQDQAAKRAAIDARNTAARTVYDKEPKTVNDKE